MKRKGDSTIALEVEASENLSAGDGIGASSQIWNLSQFKEIDRNRKYPRGVLFKKYLKVYKYSFENVLMKVSNLAARISLPRILIDAAQLRTYALCSTGPQVTPVFFALASRQNEPATEPHVSRSASRSRTSR